MDRGHMASAASEPEHVAEWMGFLMAHSGLPPDTG